MCRLSTEGLDMAIGSRIKQRRLALGYSLQEVITKLAEVGANITKAGLSKYENEKSTPKANFLFSLSNVLNVNTDYFLYEPKLELKWLAFRKHASLTKQNEEKVKNYAKEIIQGQSYLESILHPQKDNIYESAYSISNLEDAEEVAQNVREQWKLNSWPIESITQLLEDKGYYVVNVDLGDKKFDGLSGIADGTPVIITKSNVPVDRKRMNLAHELGHQFIKTKPELEESTAYRFGAAFLLPRENVYKEIGEKRSNIDINEFILLKEKYGISIQAITKRCFDLGIISESLYKQYFIYFRKNYWHVNEPGECYNNEESINFKKMIMKAIAEGIITEEKARTIYPEYKKMKEEQMENKTWRWKDLRSLDKKSKNDILKAAADIAVSDYENDNDLNAFNINEDIHEQTQ